MRQVGTIPSVSRRGNWLASFRWKSDVLASSRVAVVAGLSGLVLLAVLATAGLGGYPEPWFDEGSYLQVARNFAHGQPYAQVSADGTLDYAPAIGVGPTLLAPVAGALRLSGDSLVAARMVTVAYLLVATVLLCLASAFLLGRAAALATFGLMLALPALDWVATGRQVLGEVPALAFLIAAGIVATSRSSYRGALVSGLLCGLVLVTKGQYLLVLPAAIVLAGLFDRFDRQIRRLTWWVVVLSTAMATWAIWMISLLLLMGSGQVTENVRLLRDSSSGALIVFAPDRMLAAMKMLLGPSTLGLVAPSLVLGIVLLFRSEGQRRLGLLLLLTFQVCWFGWFTFASIAWPRYAFPALALNLILAGQLVVEIVRTVPRLAGRFAPGRAARLSRPLQAGATAAVTVAIAVVALLQLAPVFEGHDRSAQNFAGVLDRTVPPGAVVSGWEPEIGFFSDTAIQYPPLGSLDRVVRHRWLGSAETTAIGDSDAAYVMVGPFGRWVGAYDGALEGGQFVMIERVGEYELWQRLDEQQ